jgi:hypothetical protein
MRQILDFRKQIVEAVEMDGRGIEVVAVKQKNDCRRALNYAIDGPGREPVPPRFSGTVGVPSGYPSSEDRLTLSRQIEQVRPLIDVSRGNRIARHPIGELRMVEWRFRMNWA